MTAQQNTNGTGGAPDVKIYKQKNPSGNWEVIAYVGGHFYSSSTCRKKADAIAQVKQDLAERGLAA